MLARSLPAKMELDAVASSSRAPLAAAGPIARLVNHYDGPKQPRAPGAGRPSSLAQAVNEFQRRLGAFAHRRGVDLRDAVEQKLAAIPALDRDRFACAYHDPSTAPMLASILPFARAHPAIASVRLWGAPDWSEESLESNVQALLPSLLSYTKAAPAEQLDGYVVCPPPLESPSQLEQWLQRLLTELSRLDPSDDSRRRRADTPPPTPAPSPTDLPERAHRPFTFNRVGLQIALLSPLYPPGDPHHFPRHTLTVFCRAGARGAEKAIGATPL